MKDFLQGRPLAAASSSRRSETSSSTTFPPITPAHVHPESIQIEEQILPESISASGTADPQVELIPDSAGRIGHIVITCQCGEIITLQCNY